MTQLLVWTNSNPNPETICPRCLRMIGSVWIPGTEPHLPLHRNCYCAYFPEMDPDAQPSAPPLPDQGSPEWWEWISYVAYLLRVGLEISPWLLPFLAEAHELNRRREQEGDDSQPGDDETPPTNPGATAAVPRAATAAVPRAATAAVPRAATTVVTNPLDPGQITVATVASNIQHPASNIQPKGGPMPEKPSNLPTSQPSNTPVSANMGRVLLSPSESDGTHREYLCDFMAAGLVKQADQELSNWMLPADVIRAAAPMFEGRPSYLDHPDLFGFGWHQEPKVSRLIGVTSAPHWSDDHNAIGGILRLYDRAPGSPGHLVAVLFDQILEDKARGLSVPPVGLSAVFYHESHLDEDSGLRITDAIRYVESVDVVYDPGAAGYIREALAALRPSTFPGTDVPTFQRSNVQTGGYKMPEETITREAVGAQHAAPSVPEPEPAPEPKPEPEPDKVDGPDVIARMVALENQITRLTQALSGLAEKNVIKGFDQPAVRQMRSSIEQVALAVDAMLDGVRPPGDVPPLTGIRELYTLLSGDYEMTGRYDPDRIYLAAVTSSTMAGLVADALNKRVINQFQSYPKWWAPAVTEEDFASLQQVKWITLGGIGDLPTVEQGAAYTELTWDDATETADFVKKGGYLGLTMEAIDKDDTRRLQAAPRALAQAAWLTLGKTIAALFTVNTGYGITMADGVNLFNSATHGNIGSTAFSHAAWEATKVAMMKYTELNSGERLAALTKPYLIWVPVDLESAAVAELAAGEGQIGTADYNINTDALGNILTDRLQRARDRVVVCPFWTDTNDWVAQADPRLYPGLGLGYRYGRTPEIYSVASPTAGLMFTNDTMPIKVRFFFAVAPTDYRAWYKHIVS